MSKEEFSQKVIELRDNETLSDETRNIEYAYLIEAFLGIQLV
jgi:hypothetical protein